MAGPALEEDWPAEEIPHGDALFLRVHRTYLDKKTGELTHGVIRDQGGSMSTDWSRYSSAEETLQRARKPEENGIAQFAAGDARDVGLQVEHSPDRKRQNRAHTDVIGEKATEIRLKLLRRITMRIEVPPAHRPD